MNIDEFNNLDVGSIIIHISTGQPYQIIKYVNNTSNDKVIVAINQFILIDKSNLSDWKLSNLTTR